ncbi:hypothetical protein EHQ12_12225 [Leptospira gomenensis]|uniref:Uncharacterized protein n=1 Tax=Leptospira gomenensis TaxID=2484974 RepID=A0A5F1Y9B7_9LEPT|nr:hypothetical protein [Leptospira gomenensis]TGK32702.1 hypothetical protein EHQ17_12070 [Leptospira gomenensis]TGK36849.1 hypothetical protein EHQ12_12225 [Leptospira gomenensis]TGK39925.1 hypothetical protein EHQ07_19525 [Leptospira gomenensis]TGK58060.1 hypothetical protein EHQ13_14425 [Leptospira gomenensis]
MISFILRKTPLLSIFIIANLWNCQHARVELAPTVKTKKTKEGSETQGKTITFKQDYYLMGLFPRKIQYDESSLCPSRGIKEIHQYSTLWNGVCEQLTLGIYSPRSIEISCH